MSTTKTSKAGKSGKGSQSSALTSGASGGKKPPGKAGKGGKKGRKVAPVKVGKERNWGPIAMFVAVGVLAVAIIGYAFWSDRSAERLPWEEQAAAIPGIANYNETNPDMLTSQHVSGNVPYEVLPPVGGPHNGAWQNCTGIFYDSQIPSEHAVHSLEHGAVWITYEPSLPQDQVDQLAELVEGIDYMFMSQFPGLDTPISAQAWGYQLKVDSAGDERLPEFIRALRTNAGPEDAGCGGPNTVQVTGDTPIDAGGM